MGLCSGKQQALRKTVEDPEANRHHKRTDKESLQQNYSRKLQKSVQSKANCLEASNQDLYKVRGEPTIMCVKPSTSTIIPKPCIISITYPSCSPSHCLESVSIRVEICARLNLLFFITPVVGRVLSTDNAPCYAANHPEPDGLQYL